MNSQQILFDRLVNEEGDAFKEVYKQAYRPVAYYVKTNGGTESEAQDVFQEGIIGLIKMLRKPDFKATAGIVALMYAICRNQWLKSCRGRGKEISYDEFPSGITPVEIPEENDKEEQHQDAFQKVSLALDEVGESCKELILNSYYYGEKSTEIAKQTGRSSGAIRIKLMRCMNKLQLILNRNSNVEQ
jgi:RNA polymerase sigma factor (sigma-70 family)